MSPPDVEAEIQADAAAHRRAIVNSNAIILPAPIMATPSRLLLLPAEVQNVIWRMCQPTAEELEVALCLCCIEERCPFGNPIDCQNVVSPENQNAQIRSLRSLQLVNHQIDAETKPLMRYKKTLVVCDEICVKGLLKIMAYSERNLVASIKVMHVIGYELDADDLLEPSLVLTYFSAMLGAYWGKITPTHHEVVEYEEQGNNFPGLSFSRLELAVGGAKASALET